ncbi:MAG: GMP synthase, large subunit [Promethearchaeota archaeon CR_4]|nr:MAG: GMP synthase, large subunit [Candidatus Lokiarchaeota archaeon CR_4]
MKSQIIVLDFGGQTCHLISRRVRDLGVSSEILPFTVSLDQLRNLNPKGIILSGGPASVYEVGAPTIPKEIVDHCVSKKIPILGLCYGHQLLAKILGGKVAPKTSKEFGKTNLTVKNADGVLRGLKPIEIVWMSHGDQVEALPEGFEVYASSSTCPIAVYGNSDTNIYGAQFHPEVRHTLSGNQILANFIIYICQCEKDWEMKSLIPILIQKINDQVGLNGQVILGLSGGVDSSVAAVLLHNAIGDRLHAIFVNNGLLRKGEVEQVQTSFKERFGFKNFHNVDAEEIFLSRLEGIVDPEQKRKIIGFTFIEIFEEEAIELGEKFPNIKFLAQGTIFPDRVETAATSNSSSKIKSHHNVTLPDRMKLELVEPLREFYKDEVRRLGRELGMPEEIIVRHPFPGPGLAIRCVGEVKKEYLNLLRDADAILTEEIQKTGIYNELWQAFAVFLPVKTVGIMGDFRTYEYMCALRIVESTDAMTANFAKIDWDLLERISTRIINEVRGFNRVVLDISNKPPSTIEFE